MWRTLATGNRRLLAVCCSLLLFASAGCAGSGPADPIATDDSSPDLTWLDSLANPPAPAELERLLYAQLAARGIDPARQAAKAPGARNEVIDLEWTLSDPDGAGEQPADGYILTWTERLIGDYNQDGLVTVADLTPIAVYWLREVDYDVPYLHFGIADFAVGDPEFDGDVEPGEAPTPESGASNWRVARVDGDGNGLINASDLTPIGQHFSEQLSGYRVYRRGPEQTSFEPVMDPQAPSRPLLVSRETVNGGAGVDPLRPVRYAYHDVFEPDGLYEYRVVPYDALTDMEGPASIGGLDDLGSVQAAISADVTQGDPPLLVHFDASASTTLEGEIAAYRWDLNGDGLTELDTGLEPAASKTFNMAGAWLVSVDVYNSLGDSDAASVLIAVTRPPVANLKVVPDRHEVPLTATFDAAGSYDADGEVVRYEWDMDDDGIFELDTGPVPQRILNLEEPGEVKVAVQVYDNFGARDSTSITHTLVDEYDEVEDNDTKQQAMPLGVIPVGFGIEQLSGGIGPLYYDGDSEDWFAFEAESGVTASVTLEFLHDDADLNLELYDSTGSGYLHQAASFTDNEEIVKRLPRAETYYLRVLRREGSAGGNALYALSIQLDELTYDEVENNDSVGQAQDLGDISGTLLGEFWGSLGPGGYDGDSEDWFAFSVDQAADYCMCAHFFHADADLEMQLFDSSGETLIGASHSVDDDETIIASLAPGAYVLRCYQFEGDSANYWLSILFP